MHPRILEALFRRKLLLVLPVLFAGVLGVAWTAVTYDTHFESQATVWVDRPTDYSGEAVTEFNVYISPAANQTNAMREMMNTKFFAAAVLKEVDSSIDEPTIAQLNTLRINTFIYSIGEHTLLVRHQSDSAEGAQATVAAIMNQFELQFSSRIKSQAEQATAFYENQLKTARAVFDKSNQDLQEYVSKNPAAAQVNLVNQPISALSDPELAKILQNQRSASSNYTTLLDKYASANIDATSAASDRIAAYFRVVDKPEEPLLAVVPGKRALMVKPVLAGMVGVLLSASLLYVLWRMDRRVWVASDLAFVGDVYVVTLPRLKAKGRKWPPSFVRLATAINCGFRELQPKW